jgi:hypothetical protein
MTEIALPYGWSLFPPTDLANQLSGTNLFRKGKRATRLPGRRV